MPTLKEIVERSDIKEGKAFDLMIQALIVLSLISLTIESLPDLEDETRTALLWVERFTIAVFTMEYLLRWYVAENKFRYPFSLWAVIDLAAILPYYLGIDARAIRVFRLLRLLKLFRYNAAIGRFQRALALAKSEMLVFGSAALALLYLSAVGIYFFENDAQPEVFSSIPESLWWAVVTLTTVGYGDTVPVTAGGRVFSGVVMFIGIGVVAGFTGVFTSALGRTKDE